MWENDLFTKEGYIHHVDSFIERSGWRIVKIRRSDGNVNSTLEQTTPAERREILVDMQL